MVPFIDVHCHMDFTNVVKKIPDVLDSGMIVISNGINPPSNRRHLKLLDEFGSSDHSNLKIALGLYPMDADEIDPYDADKEIGFIKGKIIENPDRIMAIGEVGMDYYNGGKNDLAKKEQKEVFKKIIGLAKELRKPILVHSRKAESDVVETLEKSGIAPGQVILHCFSGKKKLIERARDNKWFFTIPTNVVRNESFQWMVKNIDINHLFCETDSPWLSPYGRGEINTPLNVIESYKMIARLKEMDLEEVKKNIYMNYQKVFL
jgi:TatD DNase family protein